MKVKDKLKIFTQSAINNAIEKSEKINREIDKEYESACFKILTEAEKKAEEIFLEELYNAEQYKNREIIRATTESKKSYMDLRNQLTGEMFDDVLNRLYDYVETENYIGKLKTEILTFREQYEGDIEICLCERDYISLKSDFEQVENMVFNITNNNIIGGFLARIKGKKLLFNNSYIEKLDDAKKSFSKFDVETN